MTPTCATCRHFTPPPESQRKAPGWLIVGTCLLGGPDIDGCSDVHRDESCERWIENPDVLESQDRAG